MSLIDLFDAGQGQGRSKSLSPLLARRMFRQSALLLFAMMVGAFVAGFSTPAHESAASRARTVASASESVFAGRLVVIDPR